MATERPLVLAQLPKSGAWYSSQYQKNTDHLANNSFHQRGREAMPRANGRAPQVGEALHVVNLLNILPDAYG